LLAERPAQIPENNDPAEPVVTAFPRPDAPVDPQTEDDVLRILRREREQLGEQIATASDLATQAVHATHGFEERIGAVETRTQEIGAAAMTAMREVAGANRVAARERVQLGVALMQRLAAYAIDRAAALLSLGGAFLLFQNIMPDPKQAQLWALALYGVTVIGPAVWLSARRQD
jgi:hypothetical protein